MFGVRIKKNNGKTARRETLDIAEKQPTKFRKDMIFSCVPSKRASLYTKIVKLNRVAEGESVSYFPTLQFRTLNYKQVQHYKLIYNERNALPNQRWKIGEPFGNHMLGPIYEYAIYAGILLTRAILSEDSSVTRRDETELEAVSSSREHIFIPSCVLSSRVLFSSCIRKDIRETYRRTMY